MKKTMKLRSFLPAFVIFCVFTACPGVPYAGDSAHIYYGGYVQGWIQPVGEEDVYTFDGDIGDVVMIRMAEVSTSLQPMLWFYGPGHAFLDSVSNGESAIIENYVLGSVGIHTIYCTDRGANDSGEYRLKLLCRNEGGTAISYGDWIPATLDRGDIDAYRFEGQAGDIVMIRMAEAEETLPLQPVISLYGPGGGLLAIDSANGDHSVSIVDHILTLSGTHAVFCDDENGDDSGDYCMKLLSRNYERDNATKISYADTLVDTLQLGDVNAYAFEGRIGDTVIISMAEEAGEFEPWISLYSPTDELLDTDTNSNYASLEAESLHMSGTYTIYCDDHASNEAGVYRLILSSPNAGPVEISYGDLVHDALPLGDLDVYYFNGDSGDKVIIRLLGDWESYPKLELFDSNDSLIRWGYDYWRADIVDFALSDSGYHRILVSDQGDDDSGSYSLSLQCRQHVKANGDTIGYDTLVTSSVTPLGDMDAYLFWGNAGDKVIIRMLGDWEYYPKLELFDPDDSLMVEDYDYWRADTVDFVLPVSGYYTIFVSDDAGEDTGDYSLSLQCRQHVKANADTIGDDYSYYIETSIAPKGDMDAYVFSGGSGDEVTIRLTGDWESYPKLELFDPGENLIGEDHDSSRADMVDFVLPDSGQYTIFASDEDGDDIGSYQLSFWRRPLADTIGYDSYLETSITPEGDMDGYVFDADSGDKVIIRLLGDWESYPRLELWDGEVLTEWGYDYWRADIVDFALPDSGYYTIFASDEGGDDTGSYSLSLQCRQHVKANADTIGDDYSYYIDASIAPKGDMDAYVFSGGSGDEVTIRLTGDWESYPKLELFDPGENLIGEDHDSSRADMVDFVLPDSGQYTIFASDEDGDDIGSYQLSFWRRPRADTIGYDSYLETSITPEGDMDGYVFDADSGDKVIIRMLGDWESYPRLELWDGEVLTEWGYDYWRADIVDFALPDSGYYTIFASDEGGDDTGSYSLSLQCRQHVKAHGDTIGYDTLVTSSITPLGDMDAYIFWGNVGDKVIIRMLGDWEYYPKLELFDPGDSLIEEAQEFWRADMVDVVLSASGYYTIFVSDEAGEDNGGYSLSLQCRQHVRASADTIGHDSHIEASITPKGDMEAYVFWGNPGDTVFIQLTGSWDYYPRLELFDPRDSLIGDDYDSSRAAIVDSVLSDAGYYTIFVSDEAGEDTGSYSLSFRLGIVDTEPPEFEHGTGDTIPFVPIDGTSMGRFSEPVDAATLNDSTFYLESTRTGERVHGVIEYDTLTSSLWFIPSGCYLPYDNSHCLPPDDSITATLTTGVTDLAGNPLGDTVTWRFATLPAVYPGDTNNDGIVNEVDVLPLGVFWSYAGQNRDSTGIHWRIKPVKVPWVPVAATYADADGNGQVDLEDLKAVSSNWHRTHPYPNPVFVPGDLDSLVTDNPYMDAFEELYDSLRCEEPATGDKVREMMETILTPTQTIGGFGLSQNFPNPFNPQTEIRYVLPEDAEVELTIYNILGERVRTLVNRFQTAGLKRVHWDGTNDSGDPVASGIYFCRIKAGEFDAHKKMLLLK